MASFLTLDTLLTVTTKAEALQNLIDILDSVGFNASSWQEGSVQRTIVEMSATLAADFTELTASMTSFAFIDTSEGDALTQFADSNYDNQRITATNTIGDVELTVESGEGPHVVAIGDLVVQDDVNGFTFRNITGDTLTDADPVSLSFEAETAGTDGNVSNNTITVLNTTLSGVTVDNPAIGTTGTWVTTAGVDEETDDDLKTRCRTRWSTLTITAPADAYENIVLNSTASITRVTVDGDAPRGAGTVDIYIAGSEGASGTSDQTTAQTAVDAQRPVTADPDVLLPTNVPFTPVAEVFITTALDTEDERIAIEQAILDYINDQPIGGTDLGDPNIIPFAILSQTVTDFDSVVNITWTTPTADISLSANELSIVSFANNLGENLTYTDV